VRGPLLETENSSHSGILSAHGFPRRKKSYNEGSLVTRGVGKEGLELGEVWEVRCSTSEETQSHVHTLKTLRNVDPVP